MKNLSYGMMGLVFASGPALAQSTMNTHGNMTNVDEQSTSSTAAPVGQAATMPPNPMPSNAMPSDQRVWQTRVTAGAPPERDARGVPVISAPAFVPPGVNQPVPPGPVIASSNQQQAFASRPADESYPACTREITDNCVQAYERGRGPRLR